MASITSSNTSAPPAGTGRFAVFRAKFRAWLRQGYIEHSITPEEAIAIGRQYCEEQGWRPTQYSVLCADDASYEVDGVIEHTFMVCGNLRAGDPQVHVRRSDGKVVGVVTAKPRFPARIDRSKLNPLNENWLPPYEK